MILNRLARAFQTAISVVTHDEKIIPTFKTHLPYPRRQDLQRGRRRTSLMNITFLGAAREVTGSSYRAAADGVRVLVDCDIMLITGFQATSTFGRRLVDGAKHVRLRANAFAANLQTQFGWDAMAPEPGFSIELD